MKRIRKLIPVDSLVLASIALQILSEQ